MNTERLRAKKIEYTSENFLFLILGFINRIYYLERYKLIKID